MRWVPPSRRYRAVRTAHERNRAGRSGQHVPNLFGLRLPGGPLRWHQPEVRVVGVMRRFPWRVQRASAASQRTDGSMPVSELATSGTGSEPMPSPWSFSRRGVQVVAAVTAIAVAGLVFYLGAVANAFGASSSAQTPSHHQTAVQPPSPAWMSVPGATQAAVTKPGSAGSGQPAAKTSAFRQIILPDLLIVTPNGVTPQQIASLQKIHG